MAEKTKIAKPVNQAPRGIAHIQRKDKALAQQTEPGKSNLSFFEANQVNGSSHQAKAVQAKLKIGAPNDKYEIEADQMASDVMRMPEPTLAQSFNNTESGNTSNGLAAVRRKCADCKREEEETPGLQKKEQKVSLRNTMKTVQREVKPTSKPTDHVENEQEELKIQRYSETNQERGPPQSDFSSKLNQSKGSGQPLDSKTNSFMSSRFGADFSNVRVHTGTDAAQMSNDINAKAFTHQNHVYFNQGQYQPNTTAGKTLLAHELTHTVQQGAVNGNVQRKCAKCEEESVQPKLTIGAPNDRFEQEADAMANQVMRKENAPTPIQTNGSNSIIQCQNECGSGVHRRWGGFSIQGDCSFVRAVRNDLNTINRNALGNSLLAWVTRDRSGLFSSIISIDRGPPAFSPVGSNGFRINYDPAWSISDACTMGAWRSAPNYVYLFHEIVHFWLYQYKGHGFHAQRECMATGLGAYFSSMNYNENKFRCSLGLPIRPCYGRSCAGAAVPTCTESPAVQSSIQRKCATCDEDRVQAAPQKDAAIEIEKPNEVVDLRGELMISDALINWLWNQPKHTGEIAAKFGTWANGNITVKVANKKNKKVSTVDKMQYIGLNLSSLNLLKEYGVLPSLAVQLEANRLSGYLGVLQNGQLASAQAIFSWLKENTAKFGLAGVEFLNGASASAVVSSLNTNGFSLEMTQISIRLGGFLNGVFDLSLDNDKLTFSVDSEVNLPLLDPTTLSLKRDASGKLSGQGNTGFNLQKLNGSVEIKYNEGIVDIKGIIGYKDDQFDGKITIVLTDYETAMNLAFSQLEPAEIASLSKVVTESNKVGERALVGFGEVNFTLNEHFQGRVKVIVDGEGYVTVIGKLAQESEIPLFNTIKPKEPYNKPLLDYRIRYGIPLLASIGIGIQMGVFANWGVNPGIIHNLFIEGVYSTNPKLTNNRYTIGGNLNISAFAEAGLFVNIFGFGELLGHEIKVGLSLMASARIDGYLDAGIILGKRSVENNPEKSEYFINGTVLMAAQPSVGLSSTFFVKLDSPWWSPVPDNTWEWPLSSHYFPVAEDIGLEMDIDHVIGSKTWPTVNFKPHSFDPAFFLDTVTEDLDSLSADNGDKEMNSEFVDKTANGGNLEKNKRGQKNKKVRADDKPSKEELAAFEAAVKKADSMDTTFGSMTVESAMEQIDTLKRMPYVQAIKLFKKKGTKHFVYIETERTNNRQMQRPVYWDVDENTTFESADQLGKLDLGNRKRKVEEIEQRYLNQNNGLASGILFEQQVEFIRGTYLAIYKDDIFTYEKPGENWIFDFGMYDIKTTFQMKREIDSERSVSLKSKAKKPKWRSFIENHNQLSKSFIDAGGNQHEVYFNLSGNNIDMQMASANPGDIEVKIKTELQGPSAGAAAEKANLNVALNQIDTFENKMEALLKTPVPENSEQTQNLINLGNAALEVSVNLLKAGKYGDEPAQTLPNNPENETVDGLDVPKPVKADETDQAKTNPDKKVEPKPDQPKTDAPAENKPVEKVIENPVSAATAHNIASIANRLNQTAYSTSTVALPSGGSETVGIGMSTPYLTNHPSKLAEGSDNTGAVQQSVYGFKKLPTRGAFGKGGGYKQSMVYIKGHLLNGNVGGPAQNHNLFPITGLANSDHKNGPENWVKKMVKSSKLLVYYGVSVRGQTSPTLVDVFGNGSCTYYFINANYLCRYATYKLYDSGRLEPNDMHTDSISSIFNVADFKALVAQRGCPQANAGNSESNAEVDSSPEEVMRKPLQNAQAKLIQRQSWEKEEHYNPYITLQRKENNNANSAGGSNPNFEQGLKAAKGNGRPMDSATQTFMENRFGANFNDVNIHTDANAAQLNNQIQAKAFTTGNDIYFNQGQYNPATADGRHLLAHELTHTLQQRAVTPTVQKSPNQTDLEPSPIHGFGIVYSDNNSAVTLFSQPEFQSSEEDMELAVGSKVVVHDKVGDFYAVSLFSDSSVSGYVEAINLVQGKVDEEGQLAVENEVETIDKDTFEALYPDLAQGIGALYWNYHETGAFVESLPVPNDPSSFVNQLGYWSALRFEQGWRATIEGNNDYSAKNIYIWLTGVDALVNSMVPLLTSAISREDAYAAQATWQLGFVTEVIMPAITNLIEHPFLDAGRAYLKRKSIQKSVESLEYQQKSPAQKALPTVIEFLRLNPIRAGAHAEYSVYGAQLAQLLVLTYRNSQLNTNGFGLSAEGVREVFELLNAESPQLAEQALYQGETVGWLVSNANMSGFGDFRAAGEGLLSGLSRGYFEEMNTSQPAPFEQWGAADSATFYLWYSLGVPSGLALGAKDLVVGLFSLFTPSFWREMYTIFTDEEHRYKIGVGLGAAMAREAQDYQEGDPSTVGWKLGVLVGRIAFEVVFSLLTAGAFQITKMAWASKFPKLAATAHLVASSRVGQIAAVSASFVMGKLDDIVRTIRSLTDRLPALTASQHMNKQIMLLQQESTVLIEAAQASKALALADRVEEAASAIARLDEQVALLESKVDDIIEMVEVDGTWVAVTDDAATPTVNNVPAKQLEEVTPNVPESPSAVAEQTSPVTELLDELPAPAEKTTQVPQSNAALEPGFAEPTAADLMVEDLLTHIDDPQLPVLHSGAPVSKTGAQQALDLNYPPLPSPDYVWVAGRAGIPYVARRRNSSAPKIYFDESTQTFQAGSKTVASTAHLPDISEINFVYSEMILPNGTHVKRVEGALGQPGTVMQHRSASAQRGVSAGTGEDAGHLVGNRFGATGDERNLSLQNREANQFGTFKALEDSWADLLNNGHQIDVNVADLTRAGENRPFMRSVSWIDQAPDGTVTRYQLDFANTTSPESRLKTGQNAVDPNAAGEVIPLRP